MEAPRLDDLLQRYFDAQLGPEEKRELEEALLSDPQARREFWQAARTHGLLRLWGEAEWGRRAAAAPQAGPEPVREPFWRPWLAAIPRPALSAGGAVAAAAALLWAGSQIGQRMAAASQQTPAPPEASSGPGASAPTVAVLKSVADVVWDESGPEYQPGEPLLPGPLRLRAGAVQLEFARGARLLLEGPAELQLVSATEAHLRRGRLRAQVPAALGGFRITTGKFSLLGRGSEFGCEMAEDGEPAVHVFAGAAELTAPRGEWVARLVPARQAMAIGPNGPQTIPARDDFFLSDEQLAQRELADSGARLEHWRASARQLSEHPELILHYTFEDREPWERSLRNQARRGPAGADATLVGCNWTQGRWPGKSGVEFSRNDDRLRVHVPGEFTALTYLAWLRVDSLPNRYASLAMTESLEVGELHWALTQQGGLLLGARRIPPTSPADWSGYTAPRVLTPERLGVWIMVASAYDTRAGTVTHYVNGEITGFARIPTPPSLRLGNLEIGNWGIRPDDPRWERLKRAGSVITERGFKGRLDEFALFAAPLPAAEIRALYDAGKPAAPPRTVAGLGAPSLSFPSTNTPPRS